MPGLRPLRTSTVIKSFLMASKSQTCRFSFSLRPERLSVSIKISSHDAELWQRARILFASRFAQNWMTKKSRNYHKSVPHYCLLPCTHRSAAVPSSSVRSRQKPKLFVAPMLNQHHRRRLAKKWTFHWALGVYIRPSVQHTRNRSRCGWACERVVDKYS